MKKYTWILGGLMAIAFTACSNEDILPEENSELPSAGKMIITAYTPGDDSASSRVTQGTYQDGQTIPLTWDNDDKISIYFAGYTKTYTKTTGANQFEGEAFTDGEGLYYGFYPALTADVQGGISPFDLSNQTGADAYLMYAESDNPATYNFRHLAAYLKVKLTLPDTDVNGTYPVTVVTPVPVTGTIDKNENGTLMCTGVKNTITKNVTFTNGVASDVWFAIPPMAEGDKTLRLKVKINSTTYVAALPRTGAIVAGLYYNAELTLTNSVVSGMPANFNTQLKTKYNTGYQIKRIIFEVNSTRSTTVSADVLQFDIVNGKEPLYATLVENVNGDEDDLYIYTTADEIEFTDDCNGLFYGNGTFFGYVREFVFGHGVNTSKVTNMQNMFNYCTSLTTLDLSSFNITNVGQYGLQRMFYKCSALTTLDLCNLQFAANQSFYLTFNYCSNLVNVFVDSDYLSLFNENPDISSDCFKTHTHQ